VYDHVLVGTDGSTSSVRAVRAAARLAEVHQARLTIVHPYASRPAVLADKLGVAEEVRSLQAPAQVARSLVTAAAEHARAIVGGALAIDTRAEPGTPVTVLCSVIEELRPDVVVVGNADVRRALGRADISTLVVCPSGRDIVIVDTSRVPRSPRRMALGRSVA
jgi:nucleotide-binding universal stress UspA family protein